MRYQILLYMTEIHVFMSPFSLIIYSHFFTVRITRSTTLTLETCTGELKLTKSSSCCLETVFPAFVLLFMHNIFFLTKQKEKDSNETNIHTRDNQTVSPNPSYTWAFVIMQFQILFLWTCCQQGNLQNLQNFFFMGP